MTNPCEKCKTELELIPANEPWHADYWICPKCESTYVVDKKSVKYFMEEMTQEEFSELMKDRDINPYEFNKIARKDFENGLTRDERYLLNKMRSEMLDMMEINGSGV